MEKTSSELRFYVVVFNALFFIKARGEQRVYFLNKPANDVGLVKPTNKHVSATGLPDNKNCFAFAILTEVRY